MCAIQDCDGSCACDTPASSCACDEVHPLRASGGQACDAGCGTCGHQQCGCCEGLVRRSQTLCCPPPPHGAEYDTELSLASSGPGSCAWQCAAGFERRTRNGAAPAFGNATRTFDWSEDVCCAKPATNSVFVGSSGCAWECSSGFVSTLERGRPWGQHSTATPAMPTPTTATTGSTAQGATTTQKRQNTMNCRGDTFPKGFSCAPCENRECAAGRVRVGACDKTTGKGFTCGNRTTTTTTTTSTTVTTEATLPMVRTCAMCANRTCASGLYRSGVCSGTTNAFRCNACPSGHFKGGTSEAAACVLKTRPACGPGESMSFGDDDVKHLDDAACTACSDGHFSATGDATACAPKRLSPCGPGEVLLLGDDTEKTLDDRACRACGPGQAPMNITACGVGVGGGTQASGSPTGGSAGATNGSSAGGVAGAPSSSSIGGVIGAPGGGAATGGVAGALSAVEVATAAKNLADQQLLDAGCVEDPQKEGCAALKKAQALADAALEAAQEAEGSPAGSVAGGDSHSGLTTAGIVIGALLLVAGLVAMLVILRHRSSDQGADKGGRHRGRRGTHGGRGDQRRGRRAADLKVEVDPRVHTLAASPADGSGGAAQSDQSAHDEASNYGEFDNVARRLSPGNGDAVPQRPKRSGLQDYLEIQSNTHHAAVDSEEQGYAESSLDQTLAYDTAKEVEASYIDVDLVGGAAADTGAQRGAANIRPRAGTNWGGRRPGAAGSNTRDGRGDPDVLGGFDGADTAGVEYDAMPDAATAARPRAGTNWGGRPAATEPQHDELPSSLDLGDVDDDLAVDGDQDIAGLAAGSDGAPGAEPLYNVLEDPGGAQTTEPTPGSLYEQMQTGSHGGSQAPQPYAALGAGAQAHYSTNAAYESVDFGTDLHGFAEPAEDSTHDLDLDVAAGDMPNACTEVDI